jgi:hypothetical protein
MRSYSGRVIQVINEPTGLRTFSVSFVAEDSTLGFLPRYHLYLLRTSRHCSSTFIMETSATPNTALQRTSSACHVRCNQPAEHTGSGRATLQPSLSLMSLGVARVFQNRTLMFSPKQLTE